MKEAYYFPHDMNAIQDPKMMHLLSECGAYGIGLFWILIEVLHQQEWGAIGEPMARQYLAFYGKQGAWDQTMLDKCLRVMLDTKLLILEDGMITSDRVKNNLKKRNELKEMGKKYALKRWGANGEPMGTQWVGNAKGKEKKGKERIKDIGFTKPLLEDIKNYCKQQNSQVNPQRFYDYYESNGWRVGKNKMKDWKAAVRTWERNDYSKNNGGGYVRRPGSGIDKLMDREIHRKDEKDKVGDVPGLFK